MGSGQLTVGGGQRSEARSALVAGGNCYIAGQKCKILRFCLSVIVFRVRSGVIPLLPGNRSFKLEAELGMTGTLASSLVEGKVEVPLGAGWLGTISPTSDRAPR